MSVHEQRRFFVLWVPGMLLGVGIVWLDAGIHLTSSGLTGLGMAVSVVFALVTIWDMKDTP